jgi:hypothetical protein
LVDKLHVLSVIVGVAYLTSGVVMINDTETLIDRSIETNSSRAQTTRSLGYLRSSGSDKTRTHQSLMRAQSPVRARAAHTLTN